jgi:hypothetical protein
MDTQTLPVPIIDQSISYGPLPEYYPSPVPGSVEPFPAAFTFGNAVQVTVIIVVPMPTSIYIDEFISVSFTPNDLGKGRYSCIINLDTNDEFDTLRLGMIKFAINITGDLKCHGSWDVSVNLPELGADKLGKVVMDANIDPTEEMP